jgi:hypothetical protein
MRDEQARRYARHLRLSEIGGLGQTALLVASARMPLRERDSGAELVAATYLAAGGVGAVVVPGANEAELAELAAHGPDTRVAAEGEGRDVAFAPRPAWWPAVEGDDVALAFWRGGLAAARWMLDAIAR